MTRPARFLAFVKVVRTKGREYLYFDTGVSVNGKRVMKRLPDRSHASFGAVYGAMKGARTKRQEVKGQTTLADLVTLYQRSKQFAKLAEGSQKTYLPYLAKITALAGIAPADEFTKADVRRVLDAMPPIAANMMCIVIRNVYAHARKRIETVKSDPTADIEMNEGGEYEPWPDELLEMALVAEDPQVRIPTALLYYTAQRIGDVCLLRWGGIHEGVLEVRQQKTGKLLDIPVHRDLRTVLDGMVKRGLTILADQGGRPLTTKQVRNRLQAFAAARGYKIVPHGLRKNAVNALLEAGCSTGETSAISGQSLAMVEHYSRRRNNKRMGSAAILKWEGRK